MKIHWVPLGVYVMTDIPLKQWAPQITAIVKILKKVRLDKFRISIINIIVHEGYSKHAYISRMH